VSLSIASAAAFLVLALGVPACAHAPCPSEVPVQARARLDNALIERIQRVPEEIVGVLVRTAEPLTDPERAQLESAGMVLGTVAGDVVTGRLRACDAVAIAELAFVRRIELARDVPRPPQPR